MCKRRLETVVTNLRRNILLSFDLCMIKIVHWRSKSYSCNNRRLWCFREAAVIAMQDHVGSTNRAVLHGLTTHTDALSMVFLPSSVCESRRGICQPHKAAQQQFVKGRFTLRCRQPRLVGFSCGGACRL